MSVVRLCHLYPQEMGIYADRGNIAVLRQRLEWRGMRLEVTEAGIGDAIRDDHDIYYLGGGQDRDQAVVAKDIGPSKGDALRSAAEDGAVVLCVCGGYQLAGHGYVGVDGAHMPGIGLLDVETRAGDGRLIGDVVIEVDCDGVPTTVVGFENHAGRTALGAGARPWGRVRHGHGNDGHSGEEGATARRVIGTYLHGPLLPKNPAIADQVLRWAREHAGASDPTLTPLPDVFESHAHAAAVARAGVSR